MSEVFKALSDPTRRQILELLRDKPMNAGEIANFLPITKPTLSGHLSILKAASLIDVTRNANQLIYRLNLSVLEGVMLSFLKKFSNSENPIKENFDEFIER